VMAIYRFTIYRTVLGRGLLTPPPARPQVSIRRGRPAVGPGGTVGRPCPNWTSPDLMPNDKILVPAGGFVVYRTALDAIGHARGDRVQEALDLARLALDDQLNRAVGQVADVPGHVVALGDAAGRVAEADPLDHAGVDHAFADGHGW